MHFSYAHVDATCRRLPNPTLLERLKQYWTYITDSGAGDRGFRDLHDMGDKGVPLTELLAKKTGSKKGLNTWFLESIPPEYMEATRPLLGDGDIAAGERNMTGPRRRRLHAHHRYALQPRQGYKNAEGKGLLLKLAEISYKLFAKYRCERQGV